MAKAAHDDVLDAPGAYLAANATRQVVCSAQPADYTEANSTYALADVTIDGSDFTRANGDTNGRKTTVAAQNAVPIDSSGTATHVALLAVANSKLLYVTTCTSQALTSGGTVNIPAWDIEFADPS